MKLHDTPDQGGLPASTPAVTASPPLRLVLLPLVALIGVPLLLSNVSYTLFHSLAELLSIAIGLTAFIVAATSRLFTRDQFVIWIAVALGWCAAVDFAHFVMYSDMSLASGENINIAAQLWVLARLLQALALLLAPVFLRHHLRISTMHLIFAIAVSTGGVLVAGGIIPRVRVPGLGETAFGLGAEFAIVFVLLVALLLFWRDRHRMMPSLFWCLQSALVIMVLVELALMLPSGGHAGRDVLAHTLRIAASWFVYAALVQNTLRAPFTLLARAAGSYDAVPEPTIITGADGVIRQVNIAAAQRAGEGPLQLVGRQSHELFHDASVRRGDCPVCRRVAQGESRFVEIIGIRSGHMVLECSLAPVAAADGEAAVVVQVIRDITEHQRLQYLHEMLGLTNRAIVHSRSADELLSALYDALILRSTFPMLYIACTDNGGMPLHIKRTHGMEADDLHALERELADAASGFGIMFPELLKGRVLCAVVPDADPANGWPARLHAHGMRSQALLPLVCEGRMCGVVGLYADSVNVFDEAELCLLNEVADDMRLAINAIVAEERRRQAEERAGFSDARFREIFESSPLPLQIVSLETGENLAINRTHRQWLGYSIDEIRTEADWLENVFEDPALRQKMHDIWWQHCRVAQSAPVPVRMNSPEMPMRCKDGSQRIARGSMTLVGGDAVLAWVDMTDVRKGDVALRESEQRFRGMIEQALSGIYVRRDGKFAYVNPRFCDIMGWSADELTGHDMMEFAVPDADNIGTIKACWARLDAGEHNVAYSVRVRRKDGTEVALGVNAAPILWDGQPAVISMAADITERQRTQAQIADYVRRLEASMKGTLQAVSTMVELRDPYTAGHERRVGLIAADIGRRLGWDAERCDAMKMVGLVHDIGKIAVPVEILSRPTRLTPTELALVRVHVQAGYDILRDIPLPYSIPVAEIIYQHHERMDGSGYPRGLRGDEILPEARVLTVADVLESMASHRPYRPALGMDVALAELERGRGIHYDVTVVDAVLAMVREADYRIPE